MIGDQKAQNVEGTPYSKIHLDEQQSNSSIVARSKSRHLVVMNNLKKREEMWDNRFHLEHIPKYDVFADKHSQNFQYAMMKQQKKNIVEFAPGKIRKKATKDMQNIEEQSEKSIQSSQSQQRSVAPPYISRQGGGQAGANPKNLIPPNYDQLKEMIKQNFEKLKISWEAQDIPIHHRELFIQCCKQISRERAIELIKTEIEDLRKGDAFIQNCIKAVKGREQCIIQLEDQISLIEKIKSQVDEQTLNKSSELITHLRLLSINAAECIVSWRNYLMDFLQNSVIKERQTMIIPYLYKEQNYLIKMRTDTHFLRSSILKEFFFFSTRQEYKIDPFILSMTDGNEETDKQIQYISKNLRKRIDNCIHLLNEEYIRVIEDEKFQSMNSKKPSYSRYQQKLPGVGPLRKSSQNSRVVQKPIQHEHNIVVHSSAKKDHPSPQSSIQSKNSPQKQFNFENSPVHQKRDSEGSNIGQSKNNHNKVPSQSELNDFPNQHSQQESKVAINENLKQNNQSQKSTSQIYQQIKGLPSHTVSSVNQSKDLISSKSQPHHPTVQQQQQQHKVQQQSQQESFKQTPHNQQELTKKDNQIQNSQSSHSVMQQKNASAEQDQKEKLNHIEQNQQHSQQVQNNQKQVADQIHVQDQAEDKQKQLQIHQNSEQVEEENQGEGVIGVPEYFEEDLMKYTEKYLETVEKKIKESVLSSTQEISRRLRTEYECGCLEYKRNGKIKGIAYYFNESSQQSRRITLMHVSAVDQKNLDQFLNQIIQYIFKNDSCDEIRFCIYHHENEEGNMQVHKEIQTIFTSKGFKWKQVNNDKYTHQRTTILALRRPADIPSTHKLKQFDHIIVESIAFIQHSSSAKPESSQSLNNFDMTVNLLGSLDQTIQDDPKFATLLSKCENKIFSRGIEQINVLMRKNYQYSDMKKESFEDKDKFIESLKSYEIQYDSSHLDSNNKIFASVSKLALKWRAFSQCQIDQNLYLRINIPNTDDHNYMKATSKINKTVYILPTDDQNTNIFLFEIDDQEQFKQDFQQNVKEVMKSLQNTQQIKEDIFIPAFETTLKQDLSIKKEDNNEYKCYQQLKISINYYTPLPKIQIKVQKNSNSQVIIRPPFVFGFINNDIDEILEIPYYSALIEKGNFCKV
ncbi:hypothetical protein TTHERM_00572140 (macronuclear) [Tetrahymena thermophila SB210]|uniref:Uncharacterized protein n=1 Tax=Tetrahymena thermophila (strain SB210) TaxID=312017 RepID=Q24HW0_TETTS|nr:hypothetical protein TTHERM_00572140 [Tetrahymena thermophila SB210]EAS07478.2 hypothetical protein TTHERM_00572140 [Tetrahymena thermophila SB210]|eukprot:XP_001027720.2 hypothetical protein TTHERM_00572140 [Tetrahymena thermophila SB210]